MQHLLKDKPEGERTFTVARTAIAALPPLPTIIRYLDEHEDVWRSIPKPELNDQWYVVNDTSANYCDFTPYDFDLKLLFKHFICWILNRNATTSAVYYYGILRSNYSRLGAEWFYRNMERSLYDWEQYWNTNIRAHESQDVVGLLKKFLYFMCDMSLGAFRPVHAEFVRSLTFFQWREKYKGVESGESILTADEEAKIIGHLDFITESINNTDLPSNKELLKACLLCLSYQHGLRPIQISRIELDHVHIYQGMDGRPRVHFTAFHAKKKIGREKRPFTRTIKREWAPLFVEYQRRRRKEQIRSTSALVSNSKLVVVPRFMIIAFIGDIVESVTGNRRTATDLRHSAAQRLADAGASMNEIAEFMGHSQEETSLVYFESSPTQASKINRALAISPIYSNVINVVRTGTIDKAALCGLPSDNQAGGVPHGVPIAGIGACTLGQSLCSKNPVLSCYTCPKFLPLNDSRIHKEALDGLRTVIRFYRDESRADTDSPAFMQLRTTLESIQSVIRHLETQSSQTEL